MKKYLSLTLLVLLMASYASAQVVTERCWHLDHLQFLDHQQNYWRSHKLFVTAEQPMYSGGLYNITEAHYGFGLEIIEPPFAHHYVGATTAVGWRLRSGFAIGGGTGFLKYNDGYTVPLYADMRYFMGRQRVQFFFAFPAGLLLNFDNFRITQKSSEIRAWGLLCQYSKIHTFLFPQDSSPRSTAISLMTQASTAPGTIASST